MAEGGKNLVTCCDVRPGICCGVAPGTYFSSVIGLGPGSVKRGCSVPVSDSATGHDCESRIPGGVPPEVIQFSSDTGMSWIPLPFVLAFLQTALSWRDALETWISRWAVFPI